jgi:UDPglucose 6-dehydrogenase
MRISIFGTGYVGLVTGCCLADAGHTVLCVDVDEARVARLRNGEVPIYEPGLEAMVQRNFREGRLAFTADAEAAVAHGTLQFIAVGTPSDEDGSADLQYVLSVADTIGAHMTDYRVIVDKSTVPVGTAEKVEATVRTRLQARGADLDFDVCSNPEFLKEGAAIEDFTRGARIIVGTESDRVRALLQECYEPYNRHHEKLMFMGRRAAELTKYAANAMLATRISFMNEISNLAERLGADVEEIRNGIGSDPRIGYHFIYPGCGYGGSCFPKDVRALENSAREAGYDTAILHAVQAVNEHQKSTLFAKLHAAFDGELAGRTIAVWGLAFKPGTDDMREAPSRTLMEELWSVQARVRAYDPEAQAMCRSLYGERADLDLVDDRLAALEGADALVVCTEWKEFRVLDPEAICNRLSTPVLVDGRNLYDPGRLKAAGILYFGMGRGESVALPSAGEQR